MRSNKNGFTLIELLVTISIIGLLSSIVLTTLTTARAKARDAQRIQQLGEIKTALMLYYEANGAYPKNVNDGYPIESADASAWNDLATDLAPYIKSLPTDPINDNAYHGTYFWDGGLYNGGYAYYYNSITPEDSYDLVTFFETSNPLDCNNKQWATHSTIYYGGMGFGIFCTDLGLPGNLYAAQ